MKLETWVTESKEVTVEGADITVSVNVWSNQEGVNLLVHGNRDGQPLRLAGAFRWEELDVLLVALNAARAA